METKENLDNGKKELELIETNQSIANKLNIHLTAEELLEIAFNVIDETEDILVEAQQTLKSIEQLDDVQCALEHTASFLKSYWAFKYAKTDEEVKMKDRESFDRAKKEPELLILAYTMATETKSVLEEILGAGLGLGHRYDWIQEALSFIQTFLVAYRKKEVDSGGETKYGR